ncbi:hypothetical protein PV326_001088 [Microctonus aethiopoides]|nr:hypothetical protein PV326_001088 [Microctonus aethiopoides]
MKYFDPVKCASLDEHNVKFGLDHLAHLLYGHHGRAVYMFIDELGASVNALVHPNRMTIKDRKKTIQLLQYITGNLLKGNRYVERSLTYACQKTSNLMLRNASNVKLFYFIEDHDFRKFYGFEEAEVKYLLEKAGRLEDFNKIKEKYNGYNTKSVDGIDTKIYGTWTIMNYLKTGNFDVYWSADILHKIKELIGHAKIRSKITRSMSHKMIGINRIDLRSSDTIETSYKMFCNGEVNEDCDGDVFIQFLMAQGFFHPIYSANDNIYLAIPNRTVYSIFDETLRSIDSIKKYYNHFPDLIENFTESLEDLARSRNEDAVYALAKNIDVLLRSGKTFETKYELQIVLDAYMLQKFRHVSVECKTSLHTKYDTVLVIADLHVMFIIEYKGFRDCDPQILDEGYDTLVEESSLKKVFPKDTPVVQNRIYFDIRKGWRGEILITYSFNSMKLNTVVSKSAQN